MTLLYIHPQLRSYSGDCILDELGPCQNQYTTTEIEATVKDYIGYTGIEYNLGSDWDPTGPLVIGMGGVENPDPVRLFFGFSLSEIPDGSTIVSATLKAYQVLTMGENVYENLGPLLVDHVNFGDTLEANASNYGDSLTSNIGTISTNDTQEYKELTTVGQYVQQDIDSGRTTSQFRLRFTNEDVEDSPRLARFGGNHEGDPQPILEVTYSE